MMQEWKLPSNYAVLCCNPLELLEHNPREYPMPKPPNPIPTVYLNVGIREDLKAKLDLHLYSVVEGRVPHGAYKTWLEARINEYFGDSNAQP